MVRSKYERVQSIFMIIQSNLVIYSTCTFYVSGELTRTCRLLDGNTCINNQRVYQIVDDTHRDFAIEISNFLLLISDATRYMMLTGQV